MKIEPEKENWSSYKVKVKPRANGNIKILPSDIFLNDNSQVTTDAFSIYIHRIKPFYEKGIIGNIYKSYHWNWIRPILWILFLLSIMYLWKQHEKEERLSSPNTENKKDNEADQIDNSTAYLSSDYTEIKESDYKGNQLSNGASPYDEFFGRGIYKKSYHNNLTILTKGDQDVIVCLVDISTNNTIRNEYIKAGSSFKMTNIPNGLYYLKTFYGKNWNPQKEVLDGKIIGGFDTDAGFQKTDNISDYLNMNQYKTISGINYTSYTVTLYPVVGGNMESEEIDANEFFTKK